MSPYPSQSILALMDVGRGPQLRFWKRVERGGPEDCWVFQGCKNKTGYGIFEVSEGYKKVRHAILAHRLAWVLENGQDVPDGKIVCHHCDNPPCCNPKHLYLGTHQTNADDKVKRGRAKSGWNMRGRKGVEHPRSLYTQEQRDKAIALRQTGNSFEEVAAAVGCKRDSVSRWWKEYVAKVAKDNAPRTRKLRVVK